MHHLKLNETIEFQNQKKFKTLLKLTAKLKLKLLFINKRKLNISKF
jgi:hypothetical protein